MKEDPKLHHVCKRISQNSLETVLEMFELLGCKVVYRPPGGVQWAMVKQGDLDFLIQLAEVGDSPMVGKGRVGSHVGFISEHPEEVISKVEDWAKSNNLRFEKGGWSKLEFWFDLPDLFVDWVVEVMHVDILNT
ncbi:MAG: hypothetical protein KW802_04460 [Candidatus Doudnabacteria bacterium]|nr:hypothetical protein [Candidatus Doudnabacteria bacterium]